jgi:hypothetical protein
VLTWRAENAAEKELWLTEFGWDASTKPAPATGTFAKWEGSTETQQAQWIVRAWMIAARLGLDRAYLYFFNDSDDAHVHGSSGLTRNFVPKPAYYSVAWLQGSLGEYRFSRVLREDAAEGWAYEFVHGTEPGRRVIAAWRVSGDAAAATLPVGAKQVVKVERMPMGAEAAAGVETMAAGDAAIRLPIGEAPVFVWVDDSK